MSRKPHVGLNLMFLVPGQTGGMEVYARELISALVTVAPSEFRFTTFLNHEAGGSSGPWDDLGPVVTLPVRATNRLGWVVGDQVRVPRASRRGQIDLVHSLASTSPALGGFLRVVTVHDLIYRRQPEAHERLRRLGMSVLVPLAVRRAHRVIAPSQTTKRDLIELLRTDPAKIDVVYQGVGAASHTPPLPSGQLRARFGLEDRAVIASFAAKRPHKNLGILIEALASIPSGERPVLVIPGYPTWYERELRQRAASLRLDDDVRFLGWLEDEEVEGLYAVASAIVFPSLYEGFGLPVIEAMARGVPVACSNRSSLPEIAGGAALLFDPTDTAAIANAIRRLLTEPKLADRLRAAGRARATEFSWGRAAHGTLGVYERALSPPVKVDP